MVIRSNKSLVGDINNTPLLNKTLKEEIVDSVNIGQTDKNVENDNWYDMKESLLRGKEAFNASAEKTSEYIDKRPWIKHTFDTTLQFFKTIKAFPRFIYPSLIGMNAQERELVLSTLDGLPLKDVGTVKSITVLPSLPDASGAAAPLPSAPFILLSRDNFSNLDWAREVLTHETGHAVDYNTGLFGLPKLFSESSKNPWGKPPYITRYAETGPGWYPSEWDDFAESYAYYHEHPEDLKLKCPEKFKRIQEMEKNGFFDKLLDQKAFRETGKYMGQIMEKVPYLQNGLAMVSFISGLVQAFKGLGDMKRAEKTGDHRLAMNATMNFTAGSCFASKLFCIVGMGIEGAKSELNRAIDKKEITPEQANAVVQTTVGCIAGPVGHAINWVISRLPWNKTCEITSNSIEVLSEKLSEVKMDIISSLSNKELTRKELKHFLKQAGFTGTEIEMINETTERYCNVNYVINNSNLQCLAGKLSAEKLNYLKMISNKEYTKEELKNLLLKASFKKEEIGIIMEVTEKERKFFNSFRGRRITDNTINNLKDKLSAHKLDFLSGMRDKELTNKDLLKVLRKMNFTNEEIALVKVCAEYVENVNSQTENIGSLKKASGIAIGGATGGMAGGFIGPYLGVMGGFALAGPVGGVLGLMAGAIAGVYAGRRIGGEVGKAVGGVLDKFCEQ